MNENQEKWALASNSVMAGHVLATAVLAAAGPKGQRVLNSTWIRMAISMGLVYAGVLAMGGDDAPE